MKRVGANTKPLSQLAYAQHRKKRGLVGGTHQAVQLAIEDGRLAMSLVRKGKGPPKIADAKAADREWAETTNADRVPPAPVSELATLRSRRETVKIELAEIELAEKRAELVAVRDVEARLVTVFSHCKTKLLGIPARVRQQDPSLLPEQISMVEAMVREVLEDLALGLEP